MKMLEGTQLKAVKHRMVTERNCRNHKQIAWGRRTIIANMSHGAASHRDNVIQPLLVSEKRVLH